MSVIQERSSDDREDVEGSGHELRPLQGRGRERAERALWGGELEPNADLEKGTVAVRYDEGKVSNEQLIEALEEAGYTVAA